MTPNTEAVYREFQFLNDIFPLARAASARVSRLSEELLEETVGWSGIDIDDDRNTDPNWWFLLDRNGKIITQVGRKKVRINLFFFRPAFYTFNAEKIGTALHRAGRADVRFLLHISPPKSNYSEISGEKSIVLYKPPKGFTIQGWYSELVRRSEQSVRDGVNDIDSEANR
jgi:hypothetical protein